jgi:NADH:ubiquinone reductase (H+-translocating)
MTGPRPEPHVVIVGGGFAGLACARGVGGDGIRVTVVDRNNYHLFVPLLYQVATAALSPADIAQPIRKLLKRQRLTRVILDEVTGVDTAAKQLRLASGRTVHYDRLVLASGSSYNYFGHEAWAKDAPAVKTIEDALRIRARLLTAFERAETSTDPAERDYLLTTVIVGGGPTGVEMAGAIADLARFALARDFRSLSPGMARVVLVEAGPRILPAFPESLSEHARAVLERRGVTVITGAAVEAISEGKVSLDGREISGATIIWGAGVKASPVGLWLGAPVDRAGRIAVNADLSLPGIPDVYLIGDAAAFTDSGTTLPALAQVAQQEGKHLGKALRALLLHGTPMPPFRFHDRGNTAVISSGAAVYDLRGWKLKGFVGWIFWAIVHVYLLTGFRNRILVVTQWLWRLATFEPGARLITRHDDPERPAAH